MKRTIALLMSLALTMLVFAGCSGGAASGNSSSSSSSFVFNGKNPVVTIEMQNGGIIKMELYPKIAPNTVYNFISLVKKGFYDGLKFHRVIPDFMIQGGDPKGDGTGDPGYVIKGEFSNNLFQNDLKHVRGVVSMARRSSPLNSAGCQFFIVVKDSNFLDGDYAAFGKVTQGMDVADAIVNVQRDSNDKPLQDQIMKKVTVDTFGVNFPVPETLPLSTLNQ